MGTCRIVLVACWIRSDGLIFETVAVFEKLTYTTIPNRYGMGVASASAAPAVAVAVVEVPNMVLTAVEKGVPNPDNAERFCVLFALAALLLVLSLLLVVVVLLMVVFVVAGHSRVYVSTASIATVWRSS